MFHGLKSFLSGDDKKVQLGLDAQTYANGSSPDPWELDIKDTKSHERIVEDKVCQNLGEVFGGNIFKEIIRKAYTAKKKEHTLLDMCDPHTLIATIQSLHKKGDAFDAVSVSDKDLNDLRIFLKSISLEDMAHIMAIYERIAPKSGKRRNEKSRDAFIALTHPDDVRKSIESDLNTKESIFHKEKGCEGSYKETQDYIKFLNRKGDKSMMEAVGYEKREKRKLSSRGLKLGNHAIELFTIVIDGGNRILGVYMMADNNPDTLRYIGKNDGNSIFTTTKGNAIIMKWCEKDYLSYTKIVTLDGRLYTFCGLYVYEKSKGGNDIKYIGFPRSNDISDMVYFDEGFNSLNINPEDHRAEEVKTFKGSSTHHHTTLVTPAGERLKFTMIYQISGNSLHGDSTGLVSRE